jgi:hypothetical protein
MKTTLVIAALISTYFVMLTLVVNKEAEIQPQQMQATQVASVNTHQAGI